MATTIISSRLRGTPRRMIASGRLSVVCSAVAED